MGIPRDQRFCERLLKMRNILFDRVNYIVCRKHKMNIIQKLCCNFAKLDNGKQIIMVLTCKFFKVLSAVYELAKQAI